MLKLWSLPQNGPKTISGIVESIVVTSIWGAKDIEQFESLTCKLILSQLDIW